MMPPLLSRPRLVRAALLKHTAGGLFPHTGPRSILLRPYSYASDGSVPDSLRKYERRFPQDSVTCANIDTYLQLRRNDTRTNNILAGVIYEDAAVRRSLKLIDVLLADPLAGGSETWYRGLQARATDENHIFVHEKSPMLLMLPGAFARQLHSYSVALPILDAETRPRFPKALPPLETAPNYLELIEINKPQDVHKLADVCLFYIHVTRDLGSMEKFPRHVRQKILLTVVDSGEYTPRSLETTPVSFSMIGRAQHVIKTNSRVLARGIEAFYQYDTKAATEYFESVQESNILEVSKLLAFYTRTETLREWTLELIKLEIASGQLTESQIQATYDELRVHELVRGSRQMHAELQTTFIPQTEMFFRQKLPWYMLYLKNDNVEYALKDFFGSHFMTRSIDSYNFLRGQLVARLQEQKYAHYSEKDRCQLDNPLQKYKANLIHERVPREVQLVVYGSLVSAFVYYQLPLSMLSLAGYMWVDLGAQSAGAIAALGWVLGFNHVSKTWHNFTQSWLKLLFDDVRLVISKECMEEGLMKELNVRFEGAKDLAAVKQQVLADLESISETKSRE